MRKLAPVLTLDRTPQPIEYLELSCGLGYLGGSVNGRAVEMAPTDLGEHSPMNGGTADLPPAHLTTSQIPPLIMPLMSAC